MNTAGLKQVLDQIEVETDGSDEDRFSVVIDTIHGELTADDAWWDEDTQRLIIMVED